MKRSNFLVKHRIIWLTLRMGRGISLNPPPPPHDFHYALSVRPQTWHDSLITLHMKPVVFAKKAKTILTSKSCNNSSHK